jgi:hypothetical protein
MAQSGQNGLSAQVCRAVRRHLALFDNAVSIAPCFEKTPRLFYGKSLSRTDALDGQEAFVDELIDDPVDQAKAYLVVTGYVAHGELRSIDPFEQ